jgi:hypothetical protein
MEAIPKVRHVTFDHVGATNSFEDFGELHPELQRIVIDGISQFIERHKLVDKSPNEGDCASVAGLVVKELTSLFEAHGYALTTAVTNVTSGTIPAYAHLGYAHHVINCAVGEGRCFAFDVTASYTSPTPGNKFFIVAGRSESEVCEKLAKITSSSWEIR